MNVCFFGGFTAGGTERATFLVANRLKKKGYDISVLNSKRNSPTFLLENIDMDFLNGNNIPQSITRLSHYLKENRVDVLVVVEALGGIVSVPAAKIAGCKVVIWEHANFYQDQGVSFIQKVRQFELKHCDAYVLLTEKDKMNFEQYCTIRTKLRKIYNIAPCLSDCDYNHNSKQIISVGHIHKIKNFIVIPEIGKIIFRKHPDWSWKIYGSTTGVEYEKIIEKIHEYGLEKNIIFAGRNSNMQDEYRKAAMYVMTSLQEGLPMVLLEAKANKLPLISFDIQTGPDEIIRHGVNGYLVQNYNIEEMTNRILELIENEEQRIRFSQNSYLDLEKFSPDVIVQQWYELLGEL